MSIQQATVRLGFVGVDKVSPMMDRIATGVSGVKDTFAAVGLKARSAQRAVAGFSAGFTDIKSAGSIVLGLAQTLIGFRDRLNEIQIAGEKAVNVTRSLQLAIGDTSGVIEKATKATGGLVEATDLEILVRKFSGLGISIEDTMRAMRSATALAQSTDRDIVQTVEAMMGALTGRMSTLAKTYGVAVEGIRPTVDGIVGAVDKALGGVDLRIYATAAQRWKVLQGNIKSNFEALMATLSFDAIYESMDRGESILMNVIDDAERLYDAVEKTEKITKSEMEALGTINRLRNEARRIVKDHADQAAEPLLVTERAIAAALEAQKLAMSGQSAEQIRLRAISKELSALAKEKAQGASEELDKQRAINALVAEQIDLEQKVAAAKKAQREMMGWVNNLVKEGERALAEQDAKKQAQIQKQREAAAKAAEEQARRAANRAAFAALVSDMTAGETGFVASPLVPSDADAATKHAVAIAHAYEELASRLAEVRRQIQAARMAGLEGGDPNAAADALQAALDAEALIREEHAQRLLEIEFQKDEALRASREALEQENVQRLATELDSARGHLGAFVGAFGGASEQMSEGLQAGRAFTAGIATLGANFDKVAKGAPGFIGAIASATTAQVNSDKAKAAIAGSLVMADAIRAFIMPPSLGTRFDLLAYGAAAAAMYGVSSALSAPSTSASGAGGATGSASRPEVITPSTQDAGSQGFTVNFYSNAPIITGGTQSGAHELAGIAMSAAGTGMNHSGAV